MMPVSPEGGKPALFAKEGCYKNHRLDILPFLKGGFYGAVDKKQ
jgi:hypothetical protein